MERADGWVAMAEAAVEDMAAEATIETRIDTAWSIAVDRMAVCVCCGETGDVKVYADGRAWHERCLRQSREQWPACVVCSEPLSPRDAEAADDLPLSESSMLRHRDTAGCIAAAAIDLELAGLFEVVSDPTLPEGVTMLRGLL